MTRTAYRTIGRTGTAGIEVKRSRFIASVERVETEGDARAVIGRIRQQHWDAGHHCSAFVLGPDGAVARSSDDGEPFGTAGAPMLEVLRGHDVSDVVAVVTRYFGGVLLGAGGLARAYSDAVRTVLDDVGVRERQLLELYDVAVGHGEAGRLENDVRSKGIRVLGVDYGVRAVLHVAVLSGADFSSLVAELTAGAAEAVAVGAEWVDG